MGRRTKFEGHTGLGFSGLGFLQRGRSLPTSYMGDPGKHCKLSSGVQPRQPNNLERFLGLQAAPGVDFADRPITFILVKFSRVRAI